MLSVLLGLFSFFKTASTGLAAVESAAPLVEKLLGIAATVAPQHAANIAHITSAITASEAASQAVLNIVGTAVSTTASNSATPSQAVGNILGVAAKAFPTHAATISGLSNIVVTDLPLCEKIVKDVLALTGGMSPEATPVQAAPEVAVPKAPFVEQGGNQ